MRNRRWYKRIVVSGNAILTFKNRGVTKSITTLIANISMRGIGLYSYSSIKVNTKVSITTNFISFRGRLKKDFIEGRVVSNKKIGYTHFLGIEFDEEISAEKQPSLFKRLKSPFIKK